MPTAKELIDVAPNYLGVPYSHLDCQAFVERCLRDIGIRKDLPGSNTWYREIMNHGWAGSPEECKKKYGMIPNGCFLFILEQDGKEPEKYRNDGIGNASHIGIYTGLSGKEMCRMGGQDEKYDFGDGAIHSSKTHECVCTSKFAGKSINGGWNRVGLWDRIDYGLGGDGKVAPYKAQVVGGGLNLRKEPSANADRIEQIPNGSIVTVVDELSGWSEVEYGSKQGYVMSEYLVSVSEQDDTVPVPRKQLQEWYDTVGDLLGLRG